MHNTPFAEQIRMVAVGLRNAGKSSLINNIFEKEISIVSDTPGTTTDPVSRSIELGKLGAVVITDTAGIDDVGPLGTLRIEKSMERTSTADIILFVTRSDMPPDQHEKTLYEQIIKGKSQIVFVLSFCESGENKQKTAWAETHRLVRVDNITGRGIDSLRKTVIELSDLVSHEITPVEGLVNENDIVLLVTPIDLAAPKGRLILPQVETIRDLLDKDCCVMVCKERELRYFYDSLKSPPKLVITDSQAFSKVAADIPEKQLLTSFSILFARKKGDLAFYVDGVRKLKSIKPGSKVLVLESCSHHRQADDIGTVKIPRLFRQLIDSDTEFDFARELPDNDKLKTYSLIINCAACMVNRNLVIQRIARMRECGVPAVNYGLFLAWVNGILPRAIEPFEDIYEYYHNYKEEQDV